MELQRAAAARCLFPVVTMMLLVAMPVAVACPYAILRGVDLGGSTAAVMLFACYIMASHCRVGQAFVTQVGTDRQAGFKTTSD